VKLELRGCEGPKANYSTWSIYWWNKKIPTDFFQSVKTFSKA